MEIAKHTAAMLLILNMAFPAMAAEKITLFSKADNSKTVTVTDGKIFRLELASNPTTGFDWHLEGLDTKSLKVVSSGFNPPKSNLVGAGGTAWWEIQPLKSGKHPIHLLYYRVWEGKEKSVDQYTLQLNVLPVETIFKKEFGKDMTIIGFKTGSLSYLAIYKEEKLLYRFSPAGPLAENYPRPLMLEKAEIHGSMIVTSWGETGADYFGTHPIVFQYKNGKFRAVSFYAGNLSDDPRIKPFSWTGKDFEVTNYYDRSEKIKTILTQGVKITGNGEIELAFYGDDLPHAAKHKMVKIYVIMHTSYAN